MKIKIQKTIKITNEKEWFRAAPPKGGEKQWQDSYSAKEFAKFVTSGDDFKELVQSVLDDISIKTRGDFVGEPEAGTKFPQKGEGRNHDLLLFNKDIVIGIEAKVDEPFGNNRSILQESNTTSKGKKARINWLLKTILPEGKRLEDREVGKLKYQLFTATAGTLLEAAKRDKKKCIFLVLAFHSKEKPVNEANKKSFEDFMRVICDENIDRKEFTVVYKENKKEFEKKVQCWFVYKEITFTPQTFNVD